jgi:hypothetical protein
MVLYALRARHAAGEIGFPLDDSWIHVRFAQNLAAGHGFSFNPGVPTGTTTSVLWTLLFAAAYRVTHEYLFTPFVLNWALCVLLCAAVYQLALCFTPSRWVALVAAAAVAVTAPLPWWALSGMEPPLYALLGTLAILLHLRLRRARGPRALLPTIAMALAALARPELLLLFPLAILDRLLVIGSPSPRLGRPVPSGAEGRKGGEVARGGLNSRLSALALHVLVFAALLTPVFLYNHLVTGYWLPSSFYSKLQSTSASAALASGDLALLISSPLRELGALLVLWAKDNLVLFLPFLFGLGWMIRAALARDGGQRSLLLPMVIVVQPLAWALASGFRDPAFQSQRYVANLNVLYVLVGVLGAAWAIERIHALRRLPVRVLLVALMLAASLARQPAAARRYARNVNNITDMQVAIARWVRDNTPKEALLAVNDVGAIAVIGDRRVLDFQGLVTPETLAPRARDLARVQQRQVPYELSQYILSRRPDYVIIFPNWYPELAMRPDLLTPVFARMIPREENITCGGDTMIVYRAAWAKR